MSAELERAYAAIRWIYQNGMQPDHSRPKVVSDVCNEAFASYRGHADWAPEPRPAGMDAQPPHEAQRDQLIDVESAFCDAVWEALKGDHNDLRKQQRILKAHRAAVASLPTAASVEVGGHIPDAGKMVEAAIIERCAKVVKDMAELARYRELTGAEDMEVEHGAAADALCEAYAAIRALTAKGKDQADG